MATEKKLFNKIKFMKPAEALAWAEDPDNEHIVNGLDEKTRTMLKKKLATALGPISPKEAGSSDPPPEKKDKPQVKRELPPLQPADPKKIKWPKVARFICNQLPNLWILTDDGELRFKRGEFVTSNKAHMRAVTEHHQYGLFILSENKELCKLYKRRR